MSSLVSCVVFFAQYYVCEIYPSCVNLPILCMICKFSKFHMDCKTYMYIIEMHVYVHMHTFYIHIDTHIYPVYIYVYI